MGLAFCGQDLWICACRGRLTTTAWQILTHSSESEVGGYFPDVRRRAAVAENRPCFLKKNCGEPCRTMPGRWRKRSGAAPAAGKRIDPATRCFQALRIVVNQELGNLDRILGSMKDLLNPGARVAIISFHSLEDRRVKTAFHQAAKGCICPPKIPQCVCGQAPWAVLLNRKVIVASETEMQENPRSRSAKLRVLEKL